MVVYVDEDFIRWAILVHWIRDPWKGRDMLLKYKFIDCKLYFDLQMYGVILFY
jgi:hypothetical protein